MCTVFLSRQPALPQAKSAATLFHAVQLAVSKATGTSAARTRESTDGGERKETRVRALKAAQPPTWRACPGPVRQGNRDLDARRARPRRSPSPDREREATGAFLNLAPASAGTDVRTAGSRPLLPSTLGAQNERPSGAGHLDRRFLPREEEIVTAVPTGVTNADLPRALTGRQAQAASPTDPQPRSSDSPRPHRLAQEAPDSPITHATTPKQQ